MSFIQTGNSYPGILGLLYYKSSTGKTLSSFAHSLLKGPSGLTSGERELIASYVSKLNQCDLCCDSHSAAAACHLNQNELVEQVKKDFRQAAISPKMKALLEIATKVQKSGREVMTSDIDKARQQGASDQDIHDAVLIAAAFCMFNRYVDGLGTIPAQDDEYPEMGKQLAHRGYKYPPLIIRWLVRRILNKKFQK